MPELGPACKWPLALFNLYPPGHQCRRHVHCVAGVSRSAAIVCAYLMVTQQLTFARAARPITRPVDWYLDHTRISPAATSLPLHPTTHALTDPPHAHLLKRAHTNNVVFLTQLSTANIDNPDFCWQPIHLTAPRFLFVLCHTFPGANCLCTVFLLADTRCTIKHCDSFENSSLFRFRFLVNLFIFITSPL